MTISAFPLHWPNGFPRTKVRERGAFKTTLHSSADEARAAFRRLASENHPDRGGSAERMAEINAAWAKAQEGSA